MTLTSITAGDAQISIGAANAATVNITDTADTAQVTIAATTDGIEPGTNGVFTVTLSAASSTDTTVSYTVAGSANAGSDYTALSGSVTILAGGTTATITVPVLDDALVEVAETVIVTLGAVTAGDPQASIGAANSATVNITDDDGAPVISNATVSVAENAAAATIVTDLADAVTGTDNDSDGDPIQYSITAGNVGGAFAIDVNTGIITVANPAVLDYETTPSIVLTVQATDGTNSGTATITVNLTNVNEAPTLSVPAAQAVLEDTPLTFSAAGLNPITVGDVDAATLQFTLSVTNGVLTLPSTAGLVFSVGSGTADGVMTFTGTAAAVNAALDGLEFLPAVNYSGGALLSILVEDLGQSGSGGPQSASATVAITVAAVNDAPSAVGDTYTVAEDGTLSVAAAAGVLANDTDADGPGLSTVLVSGPANGALVLNADGSFTYVPNADFFGTDSFTYRASDGTAQSAPTTVNLIGDGGQRRAGVLRARRARP